MPILKIYPLIYYFRVSKKHMVLGTSGVFKFPINFDQTDNYSIIE